MFRLLVLTLLGCVGFSSAQTREEKVRTDKQKIESEGFWIYNDLKRGYAEAKKQRRPMVVVLRCIPCEECVKLDEELVSQDPRIRPLLEKFVRVRLISTNGLDLSLFQFDYDQSFVVFFLHPDGTILGRFGTRSHRTNWADDVSLEGLAKALEGAFELHEQFDEYKNVLRKKRGDAPFFPTPERYPTLRGKYSDRLNYAGKVVPSCIHCHQIGEAQREYVRRKDQKIPEELLFPHPHPKSLGLILDPSERAKVKRVVPESIAEQVGFKSGDVLTRLNDQPLLSIADVQWVLHQTPASGGKVCAEVRRNGKLLNLILELSDGWRRADDLSWRVSSWSLRRMVTGGLVLSEEKNVLMVNHVGQYGPHAAAQRAGFRVGDEILTYAGKRFQRETDLLAYVVNHTKIGEKVPVEIRRNGKKRTPDPAHSGVRSKCGRTRPP